MICFPSLKVFKQSVQSWGRDVTKRMYIKPYCLFVHGSKCNIVLLENNPTFQMLSQSTWLSSFHYTYWILFENYNQLYRIIWGYELVSNCCRLTVFVICWLWRITCKQPIVSCLATWLCSDFMGLNITHFGFSD